MNSFRKVASSILLVSFIATGLWGCGPNNMPDEQAQLRAKNLNPAPSTLQKNYESAGVMVRNDLAQKLDKMSGVLSPTVIQHGGNLYVGFTHLGTEKNDDQWMAQTDGRNWKGMPYGTEQNPKSAEGMTVEQLQAEKPPNAASFNGPGATVPGNISPEMKKKVADLLRSSTPGVQSVHLSTALEDVRRLSGYKHFIMQGGDFRPHVGEFKTFVNSHLMNAETP